MKSNQKYTQEEMYLAIGLWEESGQSQTSWCKENNMCRGTLKYWLKKYRQESACRANQKRVHKVGPEDPFIPIDIATFENLSLSPDNKTAITITYPSGVQVSCPVGIGIKQLKALINL
jgi:hypothetical protein